MRQTTPIPWGALLASIIFCQAFLATGKVDPKRGTASPAGIRIGIVSTDETTRLNADALTASLSGLDNVSLVERDEIDKVFTEQSLTADVKTFFTHVGELLRADGLIILQPIVSEDKTNLSLRLVAVNSGVVIDGAVYPLPLNDPQQWGKLMSTRLSPRFPKLNVKREEAVPISLVNLRCVVDTRLSIQIEQSLSALLFHRLMAERDVFVLERRQLGKLAWEKNLSGSDDTAFWNGAYLLEGTIDRDGVVRDTLTINARLSSPREKQPIDLAVSGPRRNPSEVIEKLVSEILRAMKKQATAKTWDAEAEAERYSQEAAWASRWKSWSEAYAAADSAYALGRRTEPVAEMKIRALIEQSHTPNAPDYDERDRTWVPSLDEGGWVFDPIKNAGWNTTAPDSDKIPNALKSLQFYQAHSLLIETNQWQTNGAWIKLGIDALQATSEVLRHHYFYGQPTKSFDVSLPDLRAAARDVAHLLAERNAQSVPNNEQIDRMIELEKTIVVLAALWQDTPADTITIYRRMIADGTYARVRATALTEKPVWEQAKARSWKNPLWVGWSSEDQLHGAVLWQNFLNELQQSTNRSTRAEGALLKVYIAASDADIASATKEYYDATMDENHSRFSPEVDFSLNDTFDTLLHAKGHQTPRRQQLWKQWQEHSFARFKNYLRNAKVHDTKHMGWKEQMTAFAPDQARELMPLIDAYRERFPNTDGTEAVAKNISTRAKATPDEFTEFFASSTVDPARLKQLFIDREFTPEQAKALEPRLSSYATVMGWSGYDDIDTARYRLRAIVAAASQANATQRRKKTNTPIFKVTHYISAPFEDPNAPRVLKSGFMNFVEQNRHLYASVPAPSSTGDQRICNIVEINPNSGMTTTLTKDLLDPRFGAINYGILNGDVYWIENKSTIGKSTDVNQPPLYYNVNAPLGRDTILQVAGNRIFIVSPEMLVEFFPQDGSLKILASTRRRPSAGKLDEWNWSGRPLIELDSKGTLFATFEAGTLQTWALDPVSGEWKQLPTIEFGNANTSHLGPQRSLLISPYDQSCLDRISTTNGTFEVLLSDNVSLLPRWSMPFDYRTLRERF